MNGLELLFWSLLIVICYAYLGYGVILKILTMIKPKSDPTETENESFEFPTLTLVIPAYNELAYLEEKVKNCLSLLYPADKLQLIFVTDGSDDGSEVFLQQYEKIKVYHQEERGGKIAAMNRVMPFIDSDLVVFSDANALLNKEALAYLAAQFDDPIIGCVSGEKRISQKDKNKASSAGEGLYWKYESTLKKWSAQLYSAVGAAGELFAIRRALYQAPEKDVILDDFMISLSVISAGYKIGYEPNAFAEERGSENIKEEMKRKVRICAGGLQAIFKTLPLLNPFKYPLFAFQYFSHRVLRWTIAPIALLLLIPINIWLGYQEGGYYSILLCLHGLFYLAGLCGWSLKRKAVKKSVLFVPFYFLMMNVSALLGGKKYFFEGQSVLWEKTTRLKAN